MELSDLLSSLRPEDMQKIQDTARRLMAETTETGAPPSPAGLDPRLLGQLGRVAGLLNTPDPRCDFLLSLKPLLREPRRQRVDEAARMLRMLALLPRLSGEGGA